MSQLHRRCHHDTAHGWALAHLGLCPRNAKAIDVDSGWPVGVLFLLGIGLMFWAAWKDD